MNNNQEFSRYTVLDSQPATGEGTVARKYMATVFLWMFAALGISALMAILFSMNPTFREVLYVETPDGHLRMNGLGMIMSFLPLVFVFTMSLAFNRLSAPLLTLFFLLYAASMGMSLSVLLLAYTSGSVIGCFAGASVMFGIMAVLGYTTKQDLTSFGKLLFMALIGIVIASLINMFIGSAGINYIISIIGVAVFTGLTAYDVQKIKRIGAGLEFEGTPASATAKLAIMGALSLYLDFINLFMFILQLFGNRRD